MKYRLWNQSLPLCREMNKKIVVRVVSREVDNSAAGSFTTRRPRTNIAKIRFRNFSAERPNPAPPRGGVTPSMPTSSSTRSAKRSSGVSPPAA